MVIAIVCNAWEGAEEETKRIYWKSQVDTLFHVKYFSKLHTRSKWWCKWCDMIDGNLTKENSVKGWTAYVLCFILGLPTLGALWSFNLRRSVLTAWLPRTKEKRDIEKNQMKGKIDKLLHEREAKEAEITLLKEEIKELKENPNNGCKDMDEKSTSLLKGEVAS